MRTDPPMPPRPAETEPRRPRRPTLGPDFDRPTKKPHERAIAVAQAQDANYRVRLLRADLDAIERQAAKLQ
jgi:hypothetical protein